MVEGVGLAQRGSVHAGKVSGWLQRHERSAYVGVELLGET